MIVSGNGLGKNGDTDMEVGDYQGDESQNPSRRSQLVEVISGSNGMARTSVDIRGSDTTSISRPDLVSNSAQQISNHGDACIERAWSRRAYPLWRLPGTRVSV